MCAEPIVSTEYGRLRGTTETLLDGSQYYSFKGIPYAAPPLRELRFKAPVPPARWSGVRDARAHGAVCPQYDMYTFQVAEGDEDCLYLNVYTKSLSTKSPVMVFIHGGGFMSGSGDSAQYGPEFLLARHATLVTINYRLEITSVHSGEGTYSLTRDKATRVTGATIKVTMATATRVTKATVQATAVPGATDSVTMATIGQGTGATTGSVKTGAGTTKAIRTRGRTRAKATAAGIRTTDITIRVARQVNKSCKKNHRYWDTPDVPGNAGLKDQVLALKWVQQNISQFGGDPNNVTIFGESAGAASVTYHLLSPMSRGLFHRAIAQSGTCLNSWAVAHEPKARAFRIAKALGKDITDTKQLLQFLQSVPAIDLVKMTFKTATDDEKRRSLPMHFVPNVEKKFINVQAFITDDPIDLLLSQKINKVPLIIGYTSAEGLLMTEAMIRKIKHINENPSYLVPREIAAKIPETKQKEFGQRIVNYYTEGKGFAADRPDEITNFATDVHFSYQIHRFAHFYSRYSMPVFLYRFEYETELNMIKNVLGMSERSGACHADDLFYLFYGVLNKDVYIEQEDKLAPIVDGLVTLWTHFAATGSPTPSSGPRWPQFTASSQHYLALGHITSTKQLADKPRIDFWNTLYKDAGLPCITTSRL